MLYFVHNVLAKCFGRCCINIAVPLVGYLYVMVLINGQKLGHVTGLIVPFLLYGCETRSRVKTMKKFMSATVGWGRWRRQHFDV